MKIPRKKWLKTLIILKAFLLTNFLEIISRIRKKLRKRKRRYKKNKQLILENNKDSFYFYYSECVSSLI